MAPSLASITAPAGPSAPTIINMNNKRPRTSEISADGSIVGDDDEGDEADEAPQCLGADGDVDVATREKMARKEARTIRNRESAQRSRNQRKAHLAWLEVRVVELEAENARLRGTSSSPVAAARSVSPSSSSSGTASKASPVDVHTLASDLGVPQSVVSGTGIALASVAPPPRDLELEDVKPVIPAMSGLGAQPVSASRSERVAISLPVTGAVGVATNDNESDQQRDLREENAALRERIVLLENLVKQVVAVSNLGGLPPPGLSTSASVTSSVSSASAPSSLAIHGKASPTLFPASPINQPLPSNHPFDLASTSGPPASSSIPFSSFNTNPSQASQTATTHNTLARHSAVVATSVLVTNDQDGALQRARKHVIVPPSSGTCLEPGVKEADRGSGFELDTDHSGVSFDGINGSNGIQGQTGSEGGFGSGEIEGMVDFSFLDNADEIGTAGNGYLDFGFDAPQQGSAPAFDASAFGASGASDWAVPMSQGGQDGQIGAEGAESVEDEVNEDGWDVRMSKLIEDLESRVAGMEDEQQQQKQEYQGQFGQGLGLDLLGTGTKTGTGQGVYGMAAWAT